MILLWTLNMNKILYLNYIIINVYILAIFILLNFVEANKLFIYYKISLDQCKIIKNYL